tara:strand:+ start:1821 stop:2072 length:252 start_codon:yes stop_codon:yes gene_type:complete
MKKKISQLIKEKSKISVTTNEGSSFVGIIIEADMCSDCVIPSITIQSEGLNTIINLMMLLSIEDFDNIKTRNDIINNISDNHS